MPSSLSLGLPVAAPTGAGRRRTILAAGLVGVAWNLFGVAQWAMSLRADADALMSRGLDPTQAALTLALPPWMSVAFALGVFGGLFGSVALLLRRRSALPLLWLSLAAYSVLFAGDAWFGLFAAIPRQLAILSLVVLIAVGLLAVARAARAAHALR